jgi:CubicO group peptidase (beta-lactamase class C family)
MQDFPSSAAQSRWSRRGLLQAGAVTAALLPAGGAFAAPAGWADSGVARLSQGARDLQLVSLIVLHRGEPVLSYGDTARPCVVHSMRKALISALYGQEVAKGVIDLKATLGDLGIEDDETLTPTEKQATIADLLSARSGIYLPLAKGLGPVPGRPARGQHPPGAQWFYSNWDFNVLGSIYERLTHKDFFVAFDHNIARPLGMQDFDPYRDSDYVYQDDILGGNRRYPNYRISLSARDQARFGQLFLQNGRWGERQVVPADWVGVSTRQHARTDRPGVFSGYGYLWWTGPLTRAAGDGRLPSRVISAVGARGHIIGVIPELDTVVVVQPDTMGVAPHAVSQSQYEDLLRQVCAAHPARGT